MNTGQPLLFYFVIVCILMLAIFCMTSCSQLDGYRRTYNIYYVSPEGHRSGVGFALDPVIIRSGGK